MNAREKNDLLWFRDERERRQLIRSFSAFVQKSWPIVEPGTPYIHGFHIDAIADHLQATLTGEIRNLLINMPPRHMKSTLIAVLFPAWVWLKFPYKKFLYTSYTDTLSMRDSVKCRRLIESSWYQSFFNLPWTLEHDQNQKSKFYNTMQGYRLSTSVGGTVIGEGGDYLVVDDPHNAKEIYSDVIRKGVLEWWDTIMSTRGNDPKTVVKIIVMQRLHEEDLSGHVIAKGGWTHLKLPAEYEEEPNRTIIGWHDPRQTAGELLWPERFGRTEIDTLKRDLGARQVPGQLQQRPSAAEGNIFKRKDFKFFRQAPARYNVVIQSWDLSTKDKTGSSFTAGLIMARNGADRYILDCVHERMAFSAQCSAIVTLSQKWRSAHKKLVEDKANGPAVMDTLKRKISGLIPVEPDGDKVARANAVSPEVEAGNVWLPDPTMFNVPWVHDFITELCNFPNSANADIVDAFSQGMMELRKGGPVQAPMSGHGSGTVY